MLPLSALRPGAISGRPVVVEAFVSKLTQDKNSARTSASEITDAQPELHTAYPLSDRAGHEFLYAVSHSCACAWTDCMT